MDNKATGAGGMSLRQIAKRLGVSHTLLVLWRQGKRRLPAALEAQYHSLAQSGYSLSGYNHAGNGASEAPKQLWAVSSAWSEHRTFNPGV